MDPFFEFFKHLFRAYNLLDVLLSKLGPTWKNGWVGFEGVSKRLDRFFVYEDFAGILTMYRSWDIISSISNHFLICLQLDGENSGIHFPFKLNHMWIKDEDFSLLVRHFWNDIIIL